MHHIIIKDTKGNIHIAATCDLKSAQMIYYECRLSQSSNTTYLVSCLCLSSGLYIDISNPNTPYIPHENRFIEFKIQKRYIPNTHYHLD